MGEKHSGLRLSIHSSLGDAPTIDAPAPAKAHARHRLSSSGGGGAEKEGLAVQLLHIQLRTTPQTEVGTICAVQ